MNSVGDQKNPKKGSLIIMRHAERPPIPQHSFGNKLSITSKGKTTSKYLGEKYGSKIHSIHSSPVTRCIETASNIIEGSRQDLSIISDTMLGNPGAFISNQSIAGENWQKFGHEGVCQRLFFNDDPMKGFYPPREAILNLLKHMVSHLPPEGLTTLFVTHDIIIATLAVRLLELKHHDDIWVDYLDGIEIILSEGNLLLKNKTFIKTITCWIY